jgi:tetrahydromethanopterin S-methyltransferase subunit F
MESMRKIDAQLNSIEFRALLIGRNLHNDSISFIGGVAKEKYTTPHDIALR